MSGSVRLVGLVLEGGVVLLLPHVAALPVVAGLQCEGVASWAGQPAHHPPPPLTEESLPALQVVIQRHRHSGLLVPPAERDGVTCRKFRH